MRRKFESLAQLAQGRSRRDDLWSAGGLTRQWRCAIALPGVARARCRSLDAAKRSTRMPRDVSRGSKTQRAGAGSDDGRHSRLISP
ncbi:MAG: hypothetical protein JWL68_409 [Actinomycetia bacterium]|nr:hypothetical protein [Actinomycetes bacterium]